MKKFVPLRIAGRRPPYVMAHRGNRTLCPENTLTAFRRALEDGADILETDLHLTRDGGFVCIHDATLERTTDGRGPVSRYTLAEIRRFSATVRRPTFATEPIPTVEELFSLIPADRVVALELKDPRFRDRLVCDRLLATIRAFGLGGRGILLSFHSTMLRGFPQDSPEVPLGLISFRRLWPDRRFPLQGPVWPILFANPWYALATRMRGQLLCPLDQHPDARLGFYVKIGCDAVLTDNPAATVARLRSMGQR